MEVILSLTVQVIYNMPGFLIFLFVHVYTYFGTCAHCGSNLSLNCSVIKTISSSCYYYVAEDILRWYMREVCSGDTQCSMPYSLEDKCIHRNKISLTRSSVTLLLLGFTLSWIL